MEWKRYASSRPASKSIADGFWSFAPPEVGGEAGWGCVWELDDVFSCVLSFPVAMRRPLSGKNHCGQLPAEPQPVVVSALGMNLKGLIYLVLP